MYKGKKILGLIPARGGSKGLPKKNIKLLNGKPLIVWTIEQALNSKYLDKVVVSTDDTEIAKVSKKYGAEVPFLRPKELATDESPTIDTIFHAVNWFEDKGENFDYLALLEPTSPLRKKSDIDNAITTLIDNISRAESLVSVGIVTLEHPFYIKKIDEDGYLRAFLNFEKLIYRRQDLPIAYFPYGVIYLASINSLKKYKTFYQDKTLPFIIERWQNYEVDDLYDFICVESILKEQQIKEEDI